MGIVRLYLVVYLLFTTLTVYGQTTASPVGLVFEGANMGSSSVNQQKAYEAIKSGVKWVTLGAVWAASEEHAPTSTCQPANGPHCYYGPRMQAYHNYDFTLLDNYVSQFVASGVQIYMRVEGWHPMWAGGQPCEGFDACNGYSGAIMSDHYTTFKDAVYDLTYNMATRYGNQVAAWRIWGEPNSWAFSPQVLEDGWWTNEFMRLIQFPAHDALTTVLPGARTIGPALAAVGANGNDGSSCDAWGHCMNWLSDWTDSMLRYFDTYFSTFSITSYPSDANIVQNAVGNVWNKMVALGKQRPIWVDEFNFTTSSNGAGGGARAVTPRLNLQTAYSSYSTT